MVLVRVQHQLHYLSLFYWFIVFFLSNNLKSVENINHVLQLCNSTTTADVQTFALDELLNAIMENAKSDDERIQALDFGRPFSEQFPFYSQVSLSSAQ